jgi:hypothetical protein
MPKMKTRIFGRTGMRRISLTSFAARLATSSRHLNSAPILLNLRPSTDLKLIGNVDMGDEVSAVVFTPDGKHALATKPSVNKVALLDVDGDKVTYNKHDLLTGLYPYNIVVAPNGSIALTADNGNSGTSRWQCGYG